MAEFDTTMYGLAKQPAFEGASQSYRMEQKGLLSGDADSVAGRELKNLWARSHHLVRNNACSITAKKRLLANWIGKGIVVRWNNPNGTPNKKMQRLWDTWAAECNYDGYGDLYNTEASWGSALFESGEALCRMLVSKRKKSKIPLALHMIEAEQLDPLFNRLTTDSVVPDIEIPTDQLVRNGIGFEGSRPITYYFWKRHPGSAMIGVPGNQRMAIPAAEVIHIFERERPGQWRGVPMLAPVLLNIYEMDELTDATLQRQKAAQAISWIIEKTSMTSAIAPGTVRSSTNPSDIDPQTGKRTLIIQASAGGVQYLKAGETVKFASISDIGGNLAVLLEDEWSKIAAALGLAYHQVTGDLSSVNFSSIRAGLNELRIRVEMIQQHLFINLGLAKVTAKFQEFAGIYESAAMLEAIPVYYTPRRYGVDDLKDAQADLMEVQAGFSTLESKLAERGVIFEDIVAESKKIEASGLKLSSFPATLIPPSEPTTAAATTNKDKTNPVKTKPASTAKPKKQTSSTGDTNA